MKALAKELRKQRTERGHTQKEVAELLGITRRQYINYEKYDHIPPHRQLKKLNTLYRYDFTKLIYNDNRITKRGNVNNG